MGKGLRPSPFTSCADKAFHYPTFVSHVERKIAERGFSDDIRGLIRLGSELDWQAACSRVLDYFSFLGERDERDLLFLDMAKCQLHKSYPGAREGLIRGKEHPLAWRKACRYRRRPGR